MEQKKAVREKRALVIGGPSGVGQSTITQAIIAAHPTFARLISATTRPPQERDGRKEKHGVDYYFFTEKRFLAEIKKGNMLEWQNTRSSVYYGTYKPELDKKFQAGYCVIINPDIVGARYFKKYYNATTIFLMPESVEALRKRQLIRKPDISEDELEKRLQYASYEIEHESPFYDHIVLNEDGKLDVTLKTVEKILDKEKYPL